MVGRIIIYILCLIGVFTLNVINESYIPFIVDVVFISVSVISLLIVLVLRQRVIISVKDNSFITDVGEPYRYRITVQNRSFLPLTFCSFGIKVCYSDKKSKKIKKKLNLLCPAHGEESNVIEITCPHCENVIISIDKIYVYDYLKIFKLGKRASLQSDLVVMPKLPDVEVMSHMSSQVGEGEDDLYSTVKPGDDNTEIFDIREYQGGDKIRNIHWKLSAKKETLMVKEYGLPLHEFDTVVIDMFKDGIDTGLLDEMFALLYGLVHTLTVRGFGFNVCFYDKTYFEGRIETQNDIHSLFAQLYGIEPYEYENTCTLMYCSQVPSKRRVFYVTSKYNEHVINNMRLLDETGPVYYLIPGHVTDSWMPVKFVE